jgi:hypothetical protein
MKKPILNKEFRRMQKIAGLLNEAESLLNEQQLELDFDPNAIKLTPEQKEKFEDMIDDFIYTTGWDNTIEEAGDILAMVLTDWKCKRWKGVGKCGYNPKEVKALGEKLAQEFYDSF